MCYLSYPFSSLRPTPRQPTYPVLDATTKLKAQADIGDHLQAAGITRQPRGTRRLDDAPTPTPETEYAHVRSACLPAGAE